MFNPKGQLPDMTSAELAEKILSTPGIEGVSFLGGEPTEWAEELCEVVSLVRERSGLTFMLYTGHYLPELSGKALELAMACDVVVEGRYDKSKPESERPRPRRWIGSWNQNLIFNTNRYSEIDFSGSNTVELRIENGKVTLSGWPGAISFYRKARASDDHTSR